MRPNGTITMTGGAGNNSYNLTGPGIYTIAGGAGANALNVVCAISGDSIWLYQYGSTIDVDGTISGQDFSDISYKHEQRTSPRQPVWQQRAGRLLHDNHGRLPGRLRDRQFPLRWPGSGHAHLGGSGNDYLYANNNTDLLYVSGDGSDYYGTGSNSLIYAAPHPNVNVTLDGYGLLVSGAYIPFSYVSGIGTVEVEDGSGSDKAYYSGYDALTTIANPYYVGNGQGTQTYTFGYAPYAYNLQFAPDPTGTDFVHWYYTNNAPPQWDWNFSADSPPAPAVVPSPLASTATLRTCSGLVAQTTQVGPSQGNPWDPFLNPSTSYPGGYDTYGYWGSWDVTLTVEPGINVTNLTATATSASGAVVTFPQSFTTGGADPSGLSYYEIQNGTQVPVTSGVTSFPIGTTVVYATASDSGSIEQAPFNVTVLPLNVSQDATQIAVTVPPSGSVYGQPATLTATVVNSSPGASPLTGKVTFMDGTTRLGTGTLSTADGVTTATFTTTALATGSHSITAVYDDSYGLTKTSVAVPFNVAQDETTTMVTASPTAAVYGQAVKFTATVAVTSPGAGNPTGKVTFMDGTTTLGTGTLSTVNGIPTATFTTGALAFGSNSITAVYSGDKNDITSTSSAIAFNITQDTTKTTVTASPTATAYGQSVTFTATVAVTGLGAGKPTGKVTFMDGTDDARHRHAQHISRSYDGDVQDRRTGSRFALDHGGLFGRHRRHHQYFRGADLQRREKCDNGGDHGRTDRHGLRGVGEVQDHGGDIRRWIGTAHWNRDLHGWHDDAGHRHAQHISRSHDGDVHDRRTGSRFALNHGGLFGRHRRHQQHFRCADLQCRGRYDDDHVHGLARRPGPRPAGNSDCHCRHYQPRRRRAHRHRQFLQWLDPAGYRCGRHLQGRLDSHSHDPLLASRDLSNHGSIQRRHQ